MVSDLSKYLDLPYHLLLNKFGDLHFVAEKSNELMLNGSAISFIGGKEVFLKSLNQTLPTYAMSCLKLKNFVWIGVTKAMTHFWWGSSDGNKEIHWINWKTMYLLKDLSGMRFRNFEVFNQALLTNQAWCICQCPYTLLA